MSRPLSIEVQNDQNRLIVSFTEYTTDSEAIHWISHIYRKNIPEQKGCRENTNPLFLYVKGESTYTCHVFDMTEANQRERQVLIQGLEKVCSILKKHRIFSFEDAR